MRAGPRGVRRAALPGPRAARGVKRSQNATLSKQGDQLACERKRGLHRAEPEARAQRRPGRPVGPRDPGEGPGAGTRRPPPSSELQARRPWTCGGPRGPAEQSRCEVTWAPAGPGSSRRPPLPPELRTRGAGQRGARRLGTHGLTRWTTLPSRPNGWLQAAWPQEKRGSRSEAARLPPAGRTHCWPRSSR